MCPDRITLGAPSGERRKIQIRRGILREEPVRESVEWGLAEYLGERREVLLMIAKPLDHVPIRAVNDSVAEPSVGGLDLRPEGVCERLPSLWVENIVVVPQLKGYVGRFGISSELYGPLSE